MGAADWLRLCSERATTAMATTDEAKTTVVAPSPRAKSGGRKKSRFGRLRLQGSAMLNAKELLHQTVVTKLYPAMVQFRLSPLRGSSPFKDAVPRDESPIVGDKKERDECVEPEKELQDETELTPALAAKWLTTEASVRFAEEVKCMAADTSSVFQITSEGCGGAYFLTAESMSSSRLSNKKKMDPMGIFKPRDEEYMAPKNPRGYVKENAVVGVTEHPVNKGFRVGNGALRERAAYLLDNAYGNFSGVPVTNLMVLKVNGEEKEGSMQRFVASQCSAEDMGTLKFAIPEVHKIGILDVRLFNTDRHAGNILLSPRANDQTFGMTPIDHGFCLPSYKHLDGATFDWLQWPQAQFPFTCAELDHIAALDEARDAAVLRAVGIEEECVTTMRVCTAVLKLGAEAGFSLFEIGSLLQRDGDFSLPSQLEKAVAKATACVEQELNLSEEKSGAAFFDAVVAEVTGQAGCMFEGQPKKKVRSISCFS
ncbi:hypothetical protein BBJ28_00010274 [Nothophytophthora sp. Chile5]|nr:hypothetical protein BBJ28_00010274 [Nothophytophthora sp. Chile5]